MATSQPTLAVGRGLVAVRATLLSSTGTRTNCGVADTSAYSLCAQSVEPSLQTDAGETQTIECGTGTVRSTFTTDDTDTGIDITLNLVEDDIELQWLLVGGSQLLSAGDIIGIAPRAPGVTAPVFEFHAWEQMYDSAALAGELPYTHHCWAFCTNARIGDKTLQSGFNVVPITFAAQGATGSSIGNGSFLDIPVEAFDGDSDGGFYAKWRVGLSDLPASDTSPYNNGLGGGFISTPACSS